MKKKINGYIKNSQETIFFYPFAVWNEKEKTLILKEKTPLSTTLKIDFFKQEMTRENKELKMILTFPEKQDKILNCELKKFHQKLEFSLNIIEEIWTESKIYIICETSLNQEKIDTIEINIKILKQEV